MTTTRNHTRPLPAATPDAIFAEINERRAAVFAAILGRLDARSDVEVTEIKRVWNTQRGALIQDLVGLARQAAGRRPQDANGCYLYHGPELDAWTAKRKQLGRCGGELILYVTAKVEGETVQCTLRSRAQATGQSGNRTPLNRLVVWIGRHHRTRGYANETRHIEPARNGYDVGAGALETEVYEWLKGRVNEARVQREREERYARERAEREARMRREREERERQRAAERAAREANRRQLDELRREAELALGLEGIRLDMNARGQFTVSWTSPGIATVEELRTKLAAMAVLAPPPPEEPADDPDADDDTDWRAA